MMPFVTELHKLLAFVRSQETKNAKDSIEGILNLIHSSLVGCAGSPFIAAFPTADTFVATFDATLAAAVNIMTNRSNDYEQSSKILIDKSKPLTSTCPEPDSCSADDLKRYIITLSAHEKTLLGVIKDADRLQRAVEADAVAIPLAITEVNHAHDEPLLGVVYVVCVA